MPENYDSAITMRVPSATAKVVDDLARRYGTTRSAVLRDMVEELPRVYPRIMAERQRRQSLGNELADDLTKELEQRDLAPVVKAMVAEVMLETMTKLIEKLEVK